MSESPAWTPNPGEHARVTWYDDDDMGRRFQRTDDCCRETNWWLTSDSEARWVSDSEVLSVERLVLVPAAEAERRADQEPVSPAAKSPASDFPCPDCRSIGPTHIGPCVHRLAAEVDPHGWTSEPEGPPDAEASEGRKAPSQDISPGSALAAQSTPSGGVGRETLDRLADALTDLSVELDGTSDVEWVRLDLALDALDAVREERIASADIPRAAYAGLRSTRG